ncbi:MAG TPA: hypothetical protein VEI06_02940 [Gemmatimonadaceae bacterium]|nr:hypothetical protein [Gemmatimonadaceae bacterium]
MSRGLRRLALPLALASSLCARAQATPNTRPVATLSLSAGAMIVNARSDGRVELAVAGRDSTLQLTFLAADAQRWADSTTRLVHEATRRTASADRRSALEDEAQDGAAFTLIRSVTNGEATYRVFVANRSYGGFVFELAPGEAQAVVAAIGRGARTAVDLARESSLSPAADPALAIAGGAPQASP